MTFTVKPSAVATGDENVGVNAALKAAELVTVADPFAYPARDVETVTVADAPADRPVTVNGNVDPETVPAETDPADTEGVDV